MVVNQLDESRVLYIAEIVEGELVRVHEREVSLSRRRFKSSRVVSSTTKSLTSEGVSTSTSSIRENQIDCLPSLVSTKRTLIYSWNTSLLYTLVDQYIEKLEVHYEKVRKQSIEKLETAERSLRNIRKRSEGSRGVK